MGRCSHFGYRAPSTSLLFRAFLHLYRFNRGSKQSAVVEKFPYLLPLAKEDARRSIPGDRFYLTYFRGSVNWSGELSVEKLLFGKGLPGACDQFRLLLLLREGDVGLP